MKAQNWIDATSWRYKEDSTIFRVIKGVINLENNGTYFWQKKGNLLLEISDWDSIIVHKIRCFFKMHYSKKISDCIRVWWQNGTDMGSSQYEKPSGNNSVRFCCQPSRCVCQWPFGHSFWQQKCENLWHEWPKSRKTTQVRLPTKIHLIPFLDKSLYAPFSFFTWYFEDSYQTFLNIIPQNTEISIK